jgi:hypothetical protein
MNKLSTRAVAWILLLLLALSCVIPAFAADQAAHTVTTQLGDGLTLTQLNSLTGSTRRQQFTLDYVPGGTVQPIVAYGDTLYGKSTVEQVVQYAQEQGHHVLAAVNSDYFSTSTGVPIGMTILEGRLVTSDGGWNAIGFLEDGKAIIGHPELSITLTTEAGETYPIHALNNVRTADGLYLYTPDFDYCTRTSAEGTEVLLEVSGDLKLGKKRKATVLSVANTKNTEMQEGQMVLSLTANNKLGLDLSTILAEGDEITLRADTADERWEDVVWASGGGNILVKDGTVTADATPSGREPRTVMGVRKDGTAVIVECDGRQSSLSSGMTLAEAAQLLLSQGCTDVINLDGGGSSILAASYPGKDSQVLSSPSDGAPRAGATYLLFVATGKDTGRTYGSVVYPRSATVLAGSAVPVSAISYNKDYLGFLDATDRLEASEGYVEDGLFYAPDEPVDCLLTTGDDKCQTAIITVTDKIASLKLTRDGKALSTLTLDRGQSAQLDVLASDGLRTMLTRDDQFDFTVDGGIGTIDEEGLFVAGNTLGEGSITVSYGGDEYTLPVTISGKAATLLEGFETGTGCGTFGSAAATAGRTTDLTQVRYGSAALWLTYSGEAEDSAEYLLSDPVSLSEPSHLALSAKGTGDWQWLFLLEDDSIVTQPMNLTDESWQTVAVTIPENAVTLLGFACYGAGTGSLLVDQITGHFGAVSADVIPPHVDMTTEEGVLTARITELGEVALTKSDIILRIDGAPADFTWKNNTVTAQLPTDSLLHRITLTVRDSVGNMARKSMDMGRLDSTFADMTDHWAASHAQYLLGKGVFSPSESFNPETRVNNEMAATMLSRYLGVDTTRYTDVELPYQDTNQISVWALPHVKAMYALGIMKGSVDGMGKSVLLPQNACSRAQIMTILGRTLTRGYSYSPCTFADADKIPDWARDHIDLLTALGIITGGDGGKVDPLGTITRAQFAALLYRMY